MRRFRDATRKEAGNLRAEALQRIGQPNQFVLLETWQDQAAADTHGKAPANHPVPRQDQGDAERSRSTSACISRSRSDRFPAKGGGAAVAVVTHVDVIPPQRENGTAITKQLAEDGRKDDGNLRFEAVTQTNRQNHFTVIELWRDRKAADAHGMAAHTRAFRDKLGPASGALYDERFYRMLD